MSKVFIISNFGYLSKDESTLTLNKDEALELAPKDFEQRFSYYKDYIEFYHDASRVFGVFED